MTSMTDMGGDAPSNPVVEARIEAQNAAQWLARLTQSYAASSDDRELRLRWNRTLQKIVTPEVAPGVVLELSLPTLTLQFAERGEPSPHAIDIDGKSSTEIEAWLLVELLHRGFDRDNFSKRLPYRWSRLMVGDETKYEPQAHLAELRQLTQWFDDAADLLIRAKEVLAAQGFEAQDVSSPAAAEELICWPERFEIGFCVPVFPGADSSGSIRIGFTVGDDTAVRPGFFVCRDSETLATSKWGMVDARQGTGDEAERQQTVDGICARVKELRLASAN